MTKDDVIRLSENLIRELKESVAEQDNAAIADHCAQLEAICSAVGAYRLWDLVQDLLIASRGGYMKTIPVIHKEIDEELSRLPRILPDKSWDL